MSDSFYHRGIHGKRAFFVGLVSLIYYIFLKFHRCKIDVVMVFETLGSSLLELIKLYNYKGMPLMIVKFIAHQVLQGKSDDCILLYVCLFWAACTYALSPITSSSQRFAIFTYEMQDHTHRHQA